MTDEKLCVDLYIRVSTDRQAKEGDSLEEQENELKKFCEFRHFRIHKIYVERGRSGGNTNRPEYQKLVKDVENKKINAVVVKKIDRLSRSLLDFEALMKLLQEKEIEFISIKENFDTTSAMGKAMLRVALVFAQLEREQTSERISDVLSFRASQGLYNGGTRPHGYVTVNKELTPYPKEKETIDVMVKRFLELKSTTAVAKFLNNAGYRIRTGKLWDKRRIHHILQNPIYAGKVKWYDQIYQGIHQPFISEKIFDQIQAIFRNGQRHEADSKSEALLKRLVLCGNCGRPMTPSHSLNHQHVKYFYYRCTSTNNSEKGQSVCTYKYVPFNILESRLFTLLLSLADGSDFKNLENRILKHNQEIEVEIQALKERSRDIEVLIINVKNKKDRYLDTLISSQFLSSERKTIQERISELEHEEKQLRGQLHKFHIEQSEKESGLIAITDFKQKLVHFKIHQNTFDNDQLKAVIRSLLTEIIYHPDRLEIQFKLLPWRVELLTKEDRK